MSFGDVVNFLRKNDTQNAKSVLNRLISVDPQIFWGEFARSMELDRLDSSNVTFRDWHTLARSCIQEGTLAGLDIAQRLYSVQIQKENALEAAIDQAQDIAEKDRLEAVKKQMDCSLSRDYCQLGIVKMFIGARNLDPEILAEAERNYLKAYEEDLKEPTPRAGRAGWNLSSSMLSRAQVHLATHDYLPSFLVGWIGVEMSLRRIWSANIPVFKYSDKEKEVLDDWDIYYIIQALYMLKKINTDQRERLDRARAFRNKVIHAKGKLPTRDDAIEIMSLGNELLQIDTPEGAFYQVKLG